MDRNRSNRRTTISVSEELRKRLDKLKPYSSMSFDEFVEELADTWEATSSPPSTNGHTDRGGQE